ncbi:amidohydrolase family protein [Rhodovulum sp. DZ06]
MHGEDVNIAIDVAAGLVIRVGEAITSLSTHLAAAETRFLSELALSADPAEARAQFCRAVAENQRGLFLSRSAAGSEIAYGKGRLSGFFSMRARNAAMMMHLWPEMDLFTPSMVDFYESPLGLDPEETRVETIEEQIAFYRALSLATRGRFLPLVAFHPLRQFRNRKSERSPLRLVEDAILNHGFVGVKLHPSSGFDPLDNAMYGVNNRALRSGGCALEPDAAEGMNEAMDCLYRLCRKYDVPILTHNADSLFINKDCMRDAEDPADWTNSSDHWAQVARTEQVRVCLGHFAGGFIDQYNERQPLLGPPKRRRVMFENGKLRPSRWLETAMEGIADDPGRNLWLDSSDMAELVRSAAWHAQPHLRGERSMRRLVDRRSDDEAEREEKKALRDFAPAFTRFLEENGALAERVMYGTDWHMPDASMAGPQYRPLLEALLPEQNRAASMGLNAVEFYGLAPGRETRKRLDAFYAGAGIDPVQIPWMKKLDAAQGAARA